MLIQYLNSLKVKNKKEREALQQIHDDWMKAIDYNTMNKLQQVGQMEETSYKDIQYKDPIAVLLNMTSVDILLRKYPGLRTYIREKARQRDEIDAREKLKEDVKKKSGRRSMKFEPGNMMYDVEYGLLYY